MIVNETDIDAVAGVAWIRSRDTDRDEVITQFTVHASTRLVTMSAQDQFTLPQAAIVASVANTKAWIAQVTDILGLAYRVDEVRPVQLAFNESTVEGPLDAYFQTRLAIDGRPVAEAWLFPNRGDVLVAARREVTLRWSEFLLATQFVRLAMEPDALVRAVPMLMELLP